MHYIFSLLCKDGAYDSDYADDLGEAVVLLNARMADKLHRHKEIEAAEIYKVIDNKRTLVVSMRTFR